MNYAAGAQARAKKFTHQNDQSSDVQEIRDNIKDVGANVGDMATRQYERAQDAASGHACKRLAFPFDAIR